MGKSAEKTEIAEAAAEKAVQKKRRRWPVVAIAFTVGAAVGACASMAKRRGQEKWNQLDLRETAHTAKEKLGEAAGAVKDKTVRAAAVMKDKATKVRSESAEHGEEIAQDARQLANETRDDMRAALRS